MEFRINKIDMELRNKINEARSEEKVHIKKEASIVQDKNREEKNNGKHLKNKITMEQLKVDNVEEEQGKEETLDPQKGHFIDIRR